MRIPLSLAAVVVALLAGCSSPDAPAHTPPAPVADAGTNSPAPTPSAAAPASAAPVVHTDCTTPSEPSVPAPRPASDVPTAPRTAVAIVGAVCSAATGEPLAGVRVIAQATASFCAEGHQPWRCGYSTVTDRDGHYGLTLFDVDAYDVTVGLDGYRVGGGLLRVAHPGVTRADWALKPLP
jgi:Carboxypeptidase regulatory-like domain